MPKLTLIWPRSKTDCNKMSPPSPWLGSLNPSIPTTAWPRSCWMEACSNNSLLNYRTRKNIKPSLNSPRSMRSLGPRSVLLLHLFS